MDVAKIPIGHSPPHDVNVIVEIPQGGEPVKYELDKASGALIVGPVSVVPGAVVRCRPIGALLMEDEAGPDEKIIVVPVDKLAPFYSGVQSYQDLPRILCDQIAHFFQHYKDLERGKWVDIVRWVGPNEAVTLIADAIARAAA